MSPISQSKRRGIRLFVCSFVLSFLWSLLLSWICAWGLWVPGVQGRVRVNEFPTYNPKSGAVTVLRIWETPGGTLVQVANFRNGFPLSRSPKPAVRSLPYWSELKERWPHRPRLLVEALEKRQAYEEQGFGFPFVCLSYVSRADLGNGKIVQSEHAFMVVNRSMWWIRSGAFKAFGTQVGLPTRVIWPGLLGNTIFWSLLAISVIWLRRFLREYLRRQRTERGCCGWCGYDLRGSAERCPECGRAQVSA